MLGASKGPACHFGGFGWLGFIKGCVLRGNNMGQGGHLVQQSACNIIAEATTYDKLSRNIRCSCCISQGMLRVQVLHSQCDNAVVACVILCQGLELIPGIQDYLC